MRRSTRESTDTTDKPNINSGCALRIHPNGHFARSTDSRSVTSMIDVRLLRLNIKRCLRLVAPLRPSACYLLSLSSVSRDNAEPVPDVNSPARA